MNLFDTMRIVARQQRLIEAQDKSVKVWQKNALLAIQNQRDLLAFFINALDQADPDELRDSLVDMLIMCRDEVARVEEQIL